MAIIPVQPRPPSPGPSCPPPAARRWPRAAAAVVATACALAVAVACGGDTEPVLSGEAARGRQLAREKGCTSCHTADGRRSEGPTWKGLAGSTVPLADGSTVVADDAYLARSITEPRAQTVRGFRMPMPTTAGLTEADVDALVAYIKALKD